MEKENVGLGFRKRELRKRRRFECELFHTDPNPN
jgi:hypothetical protein